MNTEVTCGYKTCARCGDEKPISEFNRQGVRADGSPKFRGACKACTRAYNARYHAARKGTERPKQITCAQCACAVEVAAVGPVPTYCSLACRARACNERAKADGRAAQWYAASRERIVAALGPRPVCQFCGDEMPHNRAVQCGQPACYRAYRAQEYAKRKDWYREWWQRYYAENRDAILARGQRWQTENAERKRAYNREWHASPSGRASNVKKLAKRRDALLNAPNDGTGPIEWLAAMEERDDWCCALCDGAFRSGDELHWDHAMPVSRGGGTTLDNMQAAHALCNISRSNKPIDKWRVSEGIA